MHRILVEICVETADQARAAQAAGADRVELCAALSEGGVTPSLGSVETVRAQVALPMVVLIRPRRGDFLHTALEFEAMRRDVAHARAAGAGGVAVGVLTRGGEVDRERVARLVDAARPLQVAFHRAFDHCRDPRAALEALIALGVERVLTSGQAATAMAGAGLLRELVDQAKGRIAVIAAGGIHAAIAADLVRRTGVREVHLSASRWRESAMLHRNGDCALAPPPPASEYLLRDTDGEAVQACVRALRGEEARPDA